VPEAAPQQFNSKTLGRQITQKTQQRRCCRH
jgi:hypothetical protein